MRLKGEEKRMINCEFIDMSIPHAAGALYSTRRRFIHLE